MGASAEAMPSKPKTWWLALALAFGASGCGPIQSTAYLIDTEVMLEAARTAQADKLAPYEWTSANLYMVKSKEEVGYADFEQAVDYAKKAVGFATKARDVALKAAKRPVDDEPETPVADP